MLQKRDIIYCVLFKYNRSCQQFHDISCLNVPYFSHIIYVQVGNFHKETKISEVKFE